MEVKRSAELSTPPRRGDRKIARAANERGLVALQGGRTLDAIRAFLEAHQADAADVEVLNNLGYAYLMHGDFESAKPYILATLALTPQRSAAWAQSRTDPCYERRDEGRRGELCQYIPLFPK